MSFWRDVFAPRGGQSWGRVAASLALVNGLAWVGYLVSRIHEAADFVHLTNLGLFVAAVLSLVGGIYGLSKGIDAIRDIKTKQKESGNGSPESS